MDPLIESVPIKEYFGRHVRQSFEDLGLADHTAAEYLSSLLARFSLTGALFPLGQGGSELLSLADRLREIQRVWDIDGPDFDPGREVELRRQIGDYTLFMTGFFWEHVRATSMVGHYTRAGRRAYRFVAEHERALGGRDARLFRLLARRFKTYAGVITYLREVYVEAMFADWPHQLFARIVTGRLP